MQYLRPVGAGPSLKTCPRCDPHPAHSTSEQPVNENFSRIVNTDPDSAGRQKLGHPDRERNFAPDVNRV